MDLNGGEIEWLSGHLAHSVNTHTNFYRLQEAIVEIAKVSKLLLAAENGQISQYAGKTISDIDVSGMCSFLPLN